MVVVSARQLERSGKLVAMSEFAYRVKSNRCYLIASEFLNRQTKQH